ncbi:hypothetical protein [Acinetobacter schindleri]|jgi:hypothetical protein|nr:hypothetical protein [Acinetobacter schindleri]
MSIENWIEKTIKEEKPPKEAFFFVSYQATGAMVINLPYCY